MGSTARRERIFIAVASLAVLGVGASLLSVRRSLADSLILWSLILAAILLYALGDWRGWFDTTTDYPGDPTRNTMSRAWQRWRAVIVVTGLFALSVGYVALTGGFLSPFFCLLYLPVLLLTIRFGIAHGLAASFVVAAAYLLAAQQGSQMRTEWLESVSLTFPLAALFGAVFSARLAVGFRGIAAREAELRALMDVSRMLETSMDLATTINLILINAKGLVPCDVCAIYLCEGEDMLILRDCIGPSRGGISGSVSLSRLNFEGWRFGDDKVLPIGAGENVIEMNSGSSDALVATLRGTDRVLGLMYLSRESKGRRFNSGEQALLSCFAVHVGLPLQQACYRDNLEWMAFNDPMTGLANFRYFQRRLSDELGRIHRQGRPLSLLMLDIDHFKSFNDTRGHSAGDVLLGEIGRLLQETVRQGDLAARYGGEEFVILCPETEASDAGVIAERIRSAVERARFHLPDAEGNKLTEVSVSVSIGYASYPGDVSVGEEVLAAADQALYEAKRSGRNCARGVSSLKRPAKAQPRARAAAS